MTQYDILYGMDINRYAKRHNTTVEKLIQKTALDIRLLKENYKRYANRNTQLSDKELSIAKQISNAIAAKEAHLQRLKEWKEQSKYRIYSGFWLQDGSHITWEFAPGTCSLPEGVVPGDEVQVILIGKYKDDQVEADIVKVRLRTGEELTHQENGTVLHITRRAEGVPPIVSGVRATKHGWEPVRESVEQAVAGFYEATQS